MSSTTRWVGRLSAEGEISEADRALVNSVQNIDLAALRAALAAGANPQIEWSSDPGPYHSATILAFASHQITSLTYRTYGLSVNDPSLDFVNALRDASATDAATRGAAFARRLAKHLHLDEEGLSLPAAVPATWDAEERAATAAETKATAADREEGEA